MSPDEHACLDFKANINPLTDEYLAMMANAAALGSEPYAIVLVGVAEERDAQSRTTSGRVVGIAGDLHQAAERIAQRASMTKPTPVGIDIFEENVGSKPILRVEIRPTMPPHYDQRGRRATRQHTTTRPMSDEEILELLSARERHRYEGVAEETANLMMGNFRVVTDQVLDSVEEGTGGIDTVLDRIDSLETALSDLGNEDEPMSMELTMAQVMKARQMGLLYLSMRIDDLTGADIEAIDRIINSTPEPLAYVQNGQELNAWHEVISSAGEKGSDIAAAIGKLVAAHESRDLTLGPGEPRSLREAAAVMNCEKATPPRGRSKRPRQSSTRAR